MTVGDVIKLNEGLDIVLEVHFTEYRVLYGHTVLAHVTKTSAFDSLNPYKDRIVKYVYCRNRLAPIYDLLTTINHKINCSGKVIQLYI